MKSREDLELKNLIDGYNQCFYENNIVGLKAFYPDDNGLIYFDNHENNDTYTVDTHIALLENFFKNGKKTESGKVEEILIDHMNYFKTADSACICFLVRYKSFPRPAVRTTMYMEKIHSNWKIRHVHCSFEPGK